MTNWAVRAAAQGAPPPASFAANPVSPPPPTVNPVSPYAELNKLAPNAVRLANAKSVVVMSSILGVELGNDVDRAHELLDKLSDKSHPPKEEGGKENDREDGAERAGAEGAGRENDKPDDEKKVRIGEDEAGEEHKVLWQLATSDYLAVFIKADNDDKITYIYAQLRPGKEIPFEKIGETNKSPLQSARTIAWDVIPPKQPHFRLVAQGTDRKASSITLFKVKRAGDLFKMDPAPMSARK